MDDWGDPWADTNTFHTATTAIPAQTRTPATTVLTGYEDEAPWSADDTFGEFEEWAKDEQNNQEVAGSPRNRYGASGSTIWSAIDTKPSPDDYTPREEHLGENDHQSKNSTIVLQVDSPLDTVYETTHIGENIQRHTEEEEEEQEQEELEEQEHKEPKAEQESPENIPATPSSPKWGHSSSSAIVATLPCEPAASDVHLDISEEEESARLSTSTSDLSQSRALDSPRTSFDDDSREIESRASVHDRAEQSEAESADRQYQSDGDAADYNETHSDSASSGILEPPKQETSKSNDGVLNEESSPSQPPIGTLSKPNLSLVDQLFGALGTPSSKLLDPDPTTISAISTRKTWYRITRPQTLREVSTGADADNYLRVTWKDSQMRTEVSKIVERWCMEDQTPGRVMLGRSPAALFGWDSKPEKRFGPAFSRHEKSFSADVSTASIRNDDHRTAVMRKASITEVSPTLQFGWSTSPSSDSPKPISDSQQRSSLDPELNLTESGVHVPVALARFQHRNLLEPGNSTSMMSASSSHDIGSTPSSQRELWQDQNLVAISPVPQAGSFPLRETTESEDDDWGGMISAPSASIVPKPTEPTRSSAPVQNTATPTLAPIHNAAAQAVKLRALQFERQQAEPVPFHSNIKPMLRKMADSKPKPMKLKVSLGPDHKFSLAKSPSPKKLPTSGSETSIDTISSQPTCFESDISQGSAAQLPSVVDFESEQISTMLSHDMGTIDQAVTKIINDLPDLKYMLR